MPFAAGVRLGSYEIVAPLGAGGMGEVYRARDTRLDREVALKVLPADLAERPEALARFERDHAEATQWVASVEKRFPALRGRIQAWMVPLDRATFRHPETGAEMRQQVERLLGLAAHETGRPAEPRY
jgi:serine/threonine protein kinase